MRTCKRCGSPLERDRSIEDLCCVCGDNRARLEEMKEETEMLENLARTVSAAGIAVGTAWVDKNKGASNDHAME